MSKWLFFPSPGDSYRQTVTYTMDGSNGVSAISDVTGDAIFKDDAVFTWPGFFHWNVYSAASEVRFLMGSYTSGYTHAQVGTLISSLKVEYKINGGATAVLGDPLWVQSNQTIYINAGNALNNTSGLVNGDTIQFFLSDR